MRHFPFYGSKKAEKTLTEGLGEEKDIDLTVEEQQKARLKLSELALFIRKPENIKLLTPDALTEINFSSFGSFNITDKKHQAIIQVATNDFIKAKTPLVKLDMKMVAAFAGSIVALTLGALFPPLIPFVALPLLAYSSYLYGLRQKLYSDYSSTLNTLSNLYTWCFNDKKAKITMYGGTIDSRTMGDADVYESLHGKVAKMMCELGPALSNDDVKALTRNDLEDKVNEEREEAQEEAGASQYDVGLEYLIYGKGQGSAKQIFQGMLSMIGHLFSNCFNCSSKEDESEDCDSPRSYSK
jgi:hypothetical protein